jgi:hypothetical protein
MEYPKIFLLCLLRTLALIICMLDVKALGIPHDSSVNLAFHRQTHSDRKYVKFAVAFRKRRSFL